MAAQHLSAEEARLLSRCAYALLHSTDSDRKEAVQFLQCAAAAGNRDAQLSLGLWLARMAPWDRLRTGTARYKEAMRWLSMAGAQGQGQAWHAIARIYTKTEFSQRNLAQARHYLAKAAEAGEVAAQRELGEAIWRARRNDPASDVQAVYWLQKAAAHGDPQARALLLKVACAAVPAAWAQAVQQHPGWVGACVSPVLRARIALAARFGLALPEALLIDINAADRGHCLVIDVRLQYARCKRRLILVQTEEERAALNRIVRRVSGMDCSASGPEGNYRQRLYRCKTRVPAWAALVKAARRDSASGV